GHESEHNKVYWKNEGYYGFGAGASGYVNGERYNNVNPVNHYIKKIQNNERPILDAVYPTESEQMEEEMFLGLRMNQGVSRKQFNQKINITIDDVYDESIKDLKQIELIYDTGDYISLTERGKVIGNLVFEAFLLNV